MENKIEIEYNKEYSSLPRLVRCSLFLETYNVVMFKYNTIFPVSIFAFSFSFRFASFAVKLDIFLDQILLAQIKAFREALFKHFMIFFV